jgi:hypothetical protein
VCFGGIPKPTLSCSTQASSDTPTAANTIALQFNPARRATLSKFIFGGSCRIVQSPIGPAPGSVVANIPVRKGDLLHEKLLMRCALHRETEGHD